MKNSPEGRSEKLIVRSLLRARAVEFGKVYFVVSIVFFILTVMEGWGKAMGGDGPGSGNDHLNLTAEKILSVLQPALYFSGPLLTRIFDLKGSASLDLGLFNYVIILAILAGWSLVMGYVLAWLSLRPGKRKLWFNQRSEPRCLK